MQIKTNGKIFNIKNNQLVDFGGLPVFCGKCATKNKIEKISRMDNEAVNNAIELGIYFIFNNDKIVCKNCGRELEIEKTPEEFDEERLKNKKEKLENLHLILAGEDWEMGWKMYRLSTKVDTNVWNLIKHMFEYYRKGWSRGQEFEWYWGEPWGWLTMKPEEVESILWKNNHIKNGNLKFINK